MRRKGADGPSIKKVDNFWAKVCLTNVSYLEMEILDFKVSGCQIKCPRAARTAPIDSTEGER